MPIREFKPKDAERCSEIAFQGVDDDELLSSKAKAYLKKRETQKSYLAKSKKFEIFVFEKNYRIQGLAGLDKNEIRCLYVAREKRLHDIGSALLFFVEKLANGRGYKKIFAYAAANAEGFYNKNGYRKTTVKFNKTGNFHTIRMEKSFD